MIDNILGNKTNMRILRLFAIYVNRFFSIKEIQENSGLGFGNIYESLKLLKYHGIIFEAKNKSKSYKINIENIISQHMIALYKEESKTFQNIELKILTFLSKIEQELIKKFNDIETIILFGSIARGAYDKESDLDLAVIKESKFAKDKIEISKIATRIMTKIKKDKREINIQVFTKEEFLKSKEPLVKNIKAEGIDLVKLGL